MQRLYPIVGIAAAAMLAGTMQASAYTPKWLQCDGQVVAVGENAGTRPARDYYVYDDDNKNLFKYMEKTHREAIEPVRVYNGDEIRWSMDASGTSRARWSGRIDRKSLALHADYHDTDSAMTWTEQCKPTTPQTTGVSADASTSKSAPAPRSKGKTG